MPQHIVVFIDATWNSDDGGDSWPPVSLNQPAIYTVRFARS